jgi:hypothetical protein
MKAIALRGLLLASLTGMTLSARAQTLAPPRVPAQTQAPASKQAPEPAPAATQTTPQVSEIPPDSANNLPPPGSSSQAPASAAPLVQPSVAYAPQPAVVYVQPARPEPARVPKVGVRLHDGLYLRMSIGMGPGRGKYTETLTGFVPDEYKFSGLGAMLDVMLGGSPIPGWVLGGAFVGHTIINPKVKLNNTDVSNVSRSYAYNLSTFGLFTSVYPDPAAGLNFHALVGLGTLSVKTGDVTVTPEPAGPSFMGGVGYEFWIADQWSMGPDFRLAYCRGTSKSNVINHEGSLIMPTLSFVATLH